MELQPHTVSADLTNDRITVSISVIMNRLTHVSKKSPRMDRFKSFINAFLCYLNEALFLRGNLSDTEHSRGIREISV